LRAGKDNRTQREEKEWGVPRNQDVCGRRENTSQPVSGTLILGGFESIRRKNAIEESEGGASRQLVKIPAKGQSQTFKKLLGGKPDPYRKYKVGN